VDVEAAGLTEILSPVPALVPPHEPVNHSHTAPVPRLPPITERVFAVPEQVLLSVMLMMAGAVERTPTATDMVLAGPDPHVFEAVTLTVPPEEPVVTDIVAVPAPELIVHPAGTVQLYEVAPETSDTEYT
jgi:hypothetical protein